MKKSRSFRIAVVFASLTAACSGGGSSGDSGGSGGGGGTPPPPTSSYVVVAANDLGMHCIDREFSIFSILPPFNVVNAQVIGHASDGSPMIVDSTQVQVRYDAIADATGSINSYSIGKTDFWTYAKALFGVDLFDGEGLTGRYMPQDASPAGAQPFDYNTAHAWFSADGIPIIPVDDSQNSKTYPLMRISAQSLSGGAALGHLDVVLPVAAETDCLGCHATGEIAAPLSSSIIWSQNPDTEVQSKENILLLHDNMESTTLANNTPVLCARCHYSRALDLGGTGPGGDQLGKPTFSSAMHYYHGKLTNAGSPMLPDTITSCYSCHPGQVTQCERGAMRAGGMDCIDCHGGMLAVGAENNLLSGGSIDGANDGQPRRPWLDLPRCQACHTGDAVNYYNTGTGLKVHNSAYPFRLGQAYRTGDPSASPLLVNNKRFAENLNTLYRFSKGHGGILCQGCHGSTHAEWPNQTAAANDNVAAKQLQGYAGKIIECTVCHTQGSLGLTTNGPHGLHNVNDSGWVDERHGSYFENDPDGCRSCHGTDLLGTPLSRVTAARNFNVEDAQNLAQDELVRCNRCHSMPH